MNKTKTNRPICMAEEYWANSHFSVTRYCGRIEAFDTTYIIVNKEGKDVFQCSHEAEIAGRKNAIDPGEQADLCHEDFVKYFRKLGRDTFLQVLDDNSHTSEKELHKIFRQACNS